MIFSGWTEAPREIIEGITISLTFVLVPVLWHQRRHFKRLHAKHDEVHERLKKIEEKL